MKWHCISRAYYGWAKASHLNQAIGEQKQRVLDEWRPKRGDA